MKGIRALLVTLLLAAGLLALVAGLWSRSDRLIAVYWRNRLANVPDEQVGTLLSQMTAWDKASIPLLVEALNSPRPSVATESREVLWEALTRWDRLPRTESSARLRLLAESLAEQVEHFGASAQADAGELASQLVMRPVDEAAMPAWRYTAACERVLTATSEARAERAKALAAAQAKETPDSTNSSVEGGENASRPNQPFSVGAAGGHDTQTPATISVVEAEPATVLNQPSRLVDQTPVAEGVHPGSPQVSSAPLAPLPNDTAEPDRLDDQASSGAKGIVREMPKPAATSQQVEPGLLELQEPVAIDVDTVDLMRNLRSGDPKAVAVARAALVQRGFSEVQLELALRLFDPDPGVRKQLVQLLPEMRSLDATPWLLQLCRDQNADVRRSAFALMATTTDPWLIDRLLQIARQDSDSSIQRQAERLASRRDEARRPGAGRVR